MHMAWPICTESDILFLEQSLVEMDVSCRSGSYNSLYNVFRCALLAAIGSEADSCLTGLNTTETVMYICNTSTYMHRSTHLYINILQYC